METYIDNEIDSINKETDSTDNEELKWYIVYTNSNSEFKVERQLREFIEKENMFDLFGNIIIPTEDVIELKNGKEQRSQRKLYPGYVLIQMAMKKEAWHLVKSVTGVISFVGGTKSRPKPISDTEAEKIINQVTESIMKPQPKILFEIGESVRIIDGPFNNFNAYVENVNYAKNEIEGSVMVFNQPVSIKLNFKQISKS